MDLLSFCTFIFYILLSSEFCIPHSICYVLYEQQSKKSIIISKNLRDYSLIADFRCEMAAMTRWVNCSFYCVSTDFRLIGRKKRTGQANNGNTKTVPIVSTGHIVLWCIVQILIGRINKSRIQSSSVAPAIYRKP